MSDKYAIIKECIYKTADERNKDTFAKDSDKGIYPHSNKIKGLPLKNLENPNSAQVQIKINRKIGTKELNKQPATAWHLSTFSSQEQLAHTKEKQAKQDHESMLRTELKKFREELEQKYIVSQANSNYIFPRKVQRDSYAEEKEASPNDCNAIYFKKL